MIRRASLDQSNATLGRLEESNIYTTWWKCLATYEAKNTRIIRSLPSHHYIVALIKLGLLIDRLSYFAKGLACVKIVLREG